MKNSTFVILFGGALLAYFFGDFDTFYGALPEGGARLNSLMKGFLSAAAVMIFLNKARDMIKVNAAIGIIAIGTAAFAGYSFEAGKEQRLGRKLLSEHLNAEIASGARIHHNEGGNWQDASMLIEFSQEILPDTMLKSLRAIPHCNIKIPNADLFLSKIEDKNKAKFYWTHEAANTNSTKGFYYKILAVVPNQTNWFFKSPLVEAEIPKVETVEKARVYTENGNYIDTDCAKAPYVFHRKAYNSRNITISEWDEKESSDRYNEISFDNAGNPLNGQVESEFIYFVSKEEEFQKGFGKAGMMKCVGYYTYVKGIKDGPFLFYYPGRVAKAFVGQYENGIQVGTYKQYNPNGSLKQSWNNETPIAAESTALTR